MPDAGGKGFSEFPLYRLRCRSAFDRAGAAKVGSGGAGESRQLRTGPRRGYRRPRSLRPGDGLQLYPRYGEPARRVARDPARAQVGWCVDVVGGERFRPSRREFQPLGPFALRSEYDALYDGVTRSWWRGPRQVVGEGRARELALEAGFSSFCEAPARKPSPSDFRAPQVTKRLIL